MRYRTVLFWSLIVLVLALGPYDVNSNNAVMWLFCSICLFHFHSLHSFRHQTVRCSGWSVFQWWLWAWLALASPSWTAASWSSGSLAWTCPTPSCSLSSSAFFSSKCLTAMELLWALQWEPSWGSWVGSPLSAYHPPSSSQAAGWTKRENLPSSFPSAPPSWLFPSCPSCFSRGWRPSFSTMACCLRSGMCLISNTSRIQQPEPRTTRGPTAITKRRRQPSSYRTPPAVEEAQRVGGGTIMYGFCTVSWSVCGDILLHQLPHWL